MNFSQKEIAIFEGFQKLIESSVDINSIKVEDIAKSSNVGKGTIYSYFSSKEEVIAKSIMYTMINEIKSIVKKSEEKETFKDRCMISFEELFRLMTKKYRYFQIIISSESVNKICKVANENNIKENIKIFTESLIEKAIIDGINEGVINKNLDKEYIKNVFFSVFAGFCLRVRLNIENITEEDIKKQIDISYEILIKSLS